MGISQSRPPDQIVARSGDVTKHISSLWPLSFRELALDCGRDPSDSNVAIVRIVSEMRLAEETRRMRLATWMAVAVALLVGSTSVLVALVR